MGEDFGTSKLQKLIIFDSYQNLAILKFNEFS